MLPVIVAVVVVIVVVVIVLARKGAGRATERVQGRLAELDVQREAKATFLGLGSGGPGQVRVLGTIVLTPEALVFLQFVPEGEVAVPRPAITDVEVTDAYLGKDHTKPLLVVSFGGADETEQAAWEVPEPDAWRAALQG
jgi:hypothetical protein